MTRERRGDNYILPYHFSSLRYICSAVEKEKNKAAILLAGCTEHVLRNSSYTFFYL